MQGVFLVGRIVLGLYYLFSGLMHFFQLPGMSQFAAARGVPAPTLAVIGSGLLLVFAGVSFLLGLWPRWGVAAVAAFMIPVTLMMHPFWAFADPMMRMVEMTNFFKNFALLGSALMFVAIPEPWAYSVGDMLARRRRHEPVHGHG